MVEALKEMRSEDALAQLYRIATAPIPKDRLPEDTEVDTRENETVIRITAVQGLSTLAANSSIKADNLLLELVGHDDLTVRQMAARGDPGSAVGDPGEKLKVLQEKIPKEEHWYPTTKLTDIRTVPHPDVLPDLDLATFLKQTSDEGPKVKEARK